MIGQCRCADEERNGRNGRNGKNGENGENGEKSMMATCR